MQVTPENSLIFKMQKSIDLTLQKQHNVELLKNGTAQTNFIQRLGKSHGIEDLTGEEPEMYEVLSTYLRTKLKEKLMNKPTNLAEKIMMEANLLMPTAGSVLRYDDDIALKSIKDTLATEFSDFKVEQINGEDGGVFYTCILVAKLEDNVSNDIERNRFFLHSKISNFKSAFMLSISKLLPVVNVTTGSFLVNKNSSSLKFTVTILLSNTNDREWVSGNYKPIDHEKQEEIAEKETINEAGSGRKSMVDPMPLMAAVRKYKSHEINLEVLETAIKACGRAELEVFVLKNVGVDLSQIQDNNSPEDGDKPEMEESTESIF